LVLAFSLSEGQPCFSLKQIFAVDSWQDQLVAACTCLQVVHATFPYFQAFVGIHHGWSAVLYL
jgi:hypothetical protein